jgi:hypothetical protein
MFDTAQGDFFDCAMNDDCDDACEWIFWKIVESEDYEVDDETVIAACTDGSMNLQEMPEHPTIYSFYFDPQAVQAWLEKEGKMYEQVDRMYAKEWENMGNALEPIFKEFGDVLEEYDGKFKRINEKQVEQLDSTFNDVGRWLEDNFGAEEVTVSLAAKVRARKSTDNTKMYAAAGIGALALISAFLYQRSKKQEVKAPRKEQVFESLVDQETN